MCRRFLLYFACLLFLPGLVAIFCAEESIAKFDKNEIHRFLDESFVDYHRHKDIKYIRQIEERCFRNKELDFYACYNVAIFYFNNGNAVKGKEFLKQTLLSNPNFYDAINAWLNRFSADEIVIKNKNFMALHYFEAAQKFARQSLTAKATNKTHLQQKAIYHVGQAVANGYRQKQTLYRDEAFKELRHVAAFVNEVEKIDLPNKEKMQELYRVLQNEIPLSEVADVFYNYDEHQKNKNRDQLLFDYYEALILAKGSQKQRAIEHLQTFYKKLKEKTKASQNNRKLGSYFIIYIGQSSYFSSLKKEKKFRQWLEDIARDEDLPSKWIKSLW